MYKNTLMEYSGGGYDGCIYEWNFCLWDADGIWHNISATGRDGCRSEAEALVYRKVEKENSGFTANDSRLYDLNNDADRKDFATTAAPENLIRVVDAVNRIYNSDKMFWICDNCKQRFYVAASTEPGYQLINYKWQGGLVYSASELFCGACAEQGSCALCRQIVGKDALFQEYACDDCVQLALEASPDINEKIEYYKQCIQNGKQHVVVLSKLNPTYAKKYKQQHEQNTDACNWEIEALINQALELYECSR